MYNYIKVIYVVKYFQVQTMKQRLKYFQFQIIIYVQTNESLQKHDILHTRWIQYKISQISQFTFLIEDCWTNVSASI